MFRVLRLPSWARRQSCGYASPGEPSWGRVGFPDVVHGSWWHWVGFILLISAYLSLLFCFCTKACCSRYGNHHAPLSVYFPVVVVIFFVMNFAFSVAFISSFMLLSLGFLLVSLVHIANSFFVVGIISCILLPFPVRVDLSYFFEALLSSVSLSCHSCAFDALFSCYCWFMRVQIISSCVIHSLFHGSYSCIRSMV